jgi:hypothetical protein
VHWHQAVNRCVAQNLVPIIATGGQRLPAACGTAPRGELTGDEIDQLMDGAAMLVPDVRKQSVDQRSLVMLPARPEDAWLVLVLLARSRSGSAFYWVCWCANARKLSNVSSVHAGSTPPSQWHTCGSSKEILSHPGSVRHAKLPCEVHRGGRQASAAGRDHFEVGQEPNLSGMLSTVYAWADAVAHSLQAVARIASARTPHSSLGTRRSKPWPPFRVPKAATLQR